MTPTPPTGAEPVDLWSVDLRIVPASRELLDRHELWTAGRFRRDADRERYERAHTAMRRILAAYGATTAGAVRVTRSACAGCGGPHGRPELVDPPRPLSFSMTHCGDTMLLAVATTTVGVDLEREPPHGTVEHVAGRLHPLEIAELEATPQTDRPRAFARLWTRKEAFLKGIGTGLLDDSLRAHDLRPTAASPHGWAVRNLTAPPRHAAALALRADPSCRVTVRTHRLDPKEPPCLTAGPPVD
ncbi:4'-phosphopantetheinyl transferase superfamily protein [Streptomyces sp. NPDC035033]|uniref:4'-phosphopantetheinyl transferase family protein n=1 Tax=Streptomyces sp. NPDC035033 TaxID=3155368 RepID=UPI0033C35571